MGQLISVRLPPLPSSVQQAERGSVASNGVRVGQGASPKAPNSPPTHCDPGTPPRCIRSSGCRASRSGARGRRAAKRERRRAREEASAADVKLRPRGQLAAGLAPPLPPLASTDAPQCRRRCRCMPVPQRSCTRLHALARARQGMHVMCTRARCVLAQVLRPRMSVEGVEVPEV